MKTERVNSKTTLYRSEIKPDVITMCEEMADVIAWADANPHVWKIVCNNKSCAFGYDSEVYADWAHHSMKPDAILERVRYFHELVLGIGREPHLGPPISHFLMWKARFTFAHYRKAGFTGGLFVQHDAEHSHEHQIMDYTPDTLEEVIDRFLLWCGNTYETDHVSVYGKVVRQLGEKTP